MVPECGYKDCKFDSDICFIACPPSMNGYNCYIGLVTSETVIYTYYASIRFSQAVGIEDAQPFQLE